VLGLASDRRLVSLVRAGSEPAFEVVFERHAPALLGYCRQILGSHEEAEDAVQQTFASAHRSLEESDQPIDLKPWLYTIARNRCLSMLRARKPDSLPIEDEVIPSAALADQAELRDELRDLVRDLADLPEQQRSALVLFELGDLSHADIAEVIGCEEKQVKGIVFRARSGLSERREGRMAPCSEIREELSTLRKGALRRSRIRHHLRECPSCAAFREDVKRQRAQMALLLPAVPSAALKTGVLGGGAAAAGSTAAAKLAIVAAVAGSVGGAGVAIEQIREGESSPATPAAKVSDRATDTHAALGATVAAVARQAKGAGTQGPIARRRAAARRAERRRAALPDSPGRDRGLSKAAEPAQDAPGRTRSQLTPGAARRPATPPGLSKPHSQPAKPLQAQPPGPNRVSPERERGRQLPLDLPRVEPRK
jgi:RNA polymerase sigma factor (sigma-70 family)